MKSTSCGKECPFVKQGFCKEENECPNFVESWWSNPVDEQPVKITDCSPKRMLLQQQYMQSRLEGVQRALEESRNKYDELCCYLKSLIEMSKIVISQASEKPLIEGENEACPNLIADQSVE